MFYKELERVYNVLEDYKQRHRYDNAQRHIVTQLLMQFYNNTLPEWELENFGFYEIDEFKLLNETQWEDMLSTHEGIDRIMFLLRSQDVTVERYSKIIHKEEFI